MSESIKGIIKPSELNPFIKSADKLNAGIIILLYSMAFGLIYLSHRMESIPVTIICIIVMGGVQNTIATFIHEAAHGHVFSNKTLNDKLGHFFFSAPLYSYLEDYRYLHWEHHRHTGKIQKDPELGLYRAMGLKTTIYTKKEIYILFLKSILGILSIKGLIYLNKFYLEKRKEGLSKNPGLYEHACIGFWAIVVPVLMWKANLFTSFLLVWVVPYLMVFMPLLLWHGFGEHIREKEGDLSQNTFTHRFDIITTLFLYPIQSSYHLEHHLYPQLPWHAMRKFRLWAEKNPEYKRLATQLEAKSYFTGKNSIVKMSFPTEQK